MGSTNDYVTAQSTNTQGTTPFRAPDTNIYHASGTVHWTDQQDPVFTSFIGDCSWNAGFGYNPDGGFVGDQHMTYSINAWLGNGTGPLSGGGDGSTGTTGIQRSQGALYMYDVRPGLTESGDYPNSLRWPGARGHATGATQSSPGDSFYPIATETVVGAGKITYTVTFDAPYYDANPNETASGGTADPTYAVQPCLFVGAFLPRWDFYAVLPKIEVHQGLRLLIICEWTNGTPSAAGGGGANPAAIASDIVLGDAGGDSFQQFKFTSFRSNGIENNGENLILPVTGLYSVSLQYILLNSFGSGYLNINGSPGPYKFVTDTDPPGVLSGHLYGNQGDQPYVSINGTSGGPNLSSGWLSIALLSEFPPVL